MLVDDYEQDRHIREFVQSGRTSQEDIFNFFWDHVLHPDYYIEYTHQVARNAIAVSHDYFLKLQPDEQIHWLKATAKLLDFALSLKLWEHELGSVRTPDRWKNMPLFFAFVIQAIEPLQSLRHELGQLEKYMTPKAVFVEGASEARFIETLQIGSRLLNLDFAVYAYGGKSEVMHLVHLLREKKTTGHRLYLSYDTDGKSNAFVKKIQDSCGLDGIFGFLQDFESSFPPDALCLAINEYSKKFLQSKVTLSLEDTVDLVKGKKAFAAEVKDKLGVDLSKPRFGTILGELMMPDLEKYWRPIVNNEPDDTFKRFEIHDFLKFLIAY